MTSKSELAMTFYSWNRLGLNDIEVKKKSFTFLKRG